MNDRSKERPFGISDKLGYLFGDFGNDFTFIFASSYLMVFYTKVLGISGAVVGLLFLLSRCVDAFTDVGMGRIVDMLPPAADGRFRPWIRRMCIPTALASSLMYLYFFRDFPYGVRVAYMFITYILWGSFCYTSINIPYGSMASVISTDATDRASLSTFRSIGSTLASLVIGMATPLIVYTTDAAGNQIPIPERFTIVAVAFGILAVLCHLLCYRLCKERVTIHPRDRSEKNAPFFALVKNLLKSRPLLSIIGAALLLLLAMLLTQAMNSYLFLDYFRNTKIISVVTLLSVGGSLLVAPFATKIAGKFGKKEAGSIAVLFSGVVYLLMYILQIRSIPLFVFMIFISFLTMGFFNMIIWAFITDVIDDQEVRSGRRDDGTVYAIYSFARKLGQALAGGIGGFALTAIGYVTSTEPVVQSESTIHGIYTVSTLIPGLCFIAVFLIMFFAYPLSKKRVSENIEELNRRRLNQAD